MDEKQSTFAASENTRPADTQQDEKYQKMTRTPVSRLILGLALPCIISMLVTSFYNMADTFFVGLLHDKSATAAVGVIFSLMAVIQATGFFFGQGSGTFISRELGKQNQESASCMAATSFFSALTVGAVICLLGQIFLEPLAYLLGSTDTILPYSTAYLRYILFGAPWMTSSLVLNNQLRFQGNAAYAMVGIATGAIINIILDPLLIFGFHMGVSGAALATIISQFISFGMLLLGTMRGNSLRVRISQVRLRWVYFLNMIRGGLPSLARQSLASVATICLNWAVRPYGDAAIAAMSVVQRIMMFGASAMIGFGQGFQPVCGFNFGAGLYDRVKEGFRFCVKTSTVFLAAVGAVGFLFAPRLIAVFQSDPEVVAFGTRALRFQCVTFCAQGWIVMSNMMQQTIGETGSATFLAVARQGVFFIPAVWILSHIWGAGGVQMAQSTADLLTLFCAVPLQLLTLRKLRVRPESP